jgi:cell division septation protein DedD
MDEVLLRRLIGAFVLVALAFGIASLLPDPQRARDAADRVVKYDLRTGKAVTEPLPAKPPATKPPTAKPWEPPESQAAPSASPNPPVVLKESPKEGTLPARTVKPPSTTAGTVPPKASASAVPPAADHRPSLKVDETLGEQASAYYVQIGSFGSQTNARAVLQKLYGLGLPAIIQTVPVERTLWYRVRVGPYPALASANAALAKVQKQGYPQAKLIKP